MTIDPPAAGGRAGCGSPRQLGDYLRGACTSTEAAAVEHHLGRCVACTAWAERLAGASPPARDTGSLAAVLAAALAVRPAAPGTRAALGAAPAAAPPPYGRRVSVLDRLLVELGPDDWGRLAAAGWTVRELVAHLYAVDGLVLAAVSGDADAPPDTDAVSRTHSVLAEAATWSPREVRRRWYDRAERLCAAAAPATADTVTAGGWTTTVADHLTARAFETWIHTRDIAAVAGIAVPEPAGAELHAMADLALRLLAAPWADTVAGRPAEVALTVTLTGAGGSTWSLAGDVAREEAGPAVRPAATVLTAGIVEFCLLVGDRTTPAALAARTAGDERLGAALLALAPSLSGP